MSEVFVGTGNNKRADVFTIFSAFKNMEEFLLIVFTSVTYN